jgi:hypothetical protein
VGGKQQGVHKCLQHSIGVVSLRLYGPIYRESARTFLQDEVGERKHGEDEQNNRVLRLYVSVPCWSVSHSCLPPPPPPHTQTLCVHVSAAGITRDGLMMRMKPEQWQEVIDTNLSSVFYASQVRQGGVGAGESEEGGQAGGRQLRGREGRGQAGSRHPGGVRATARPQLEPCGAAGKGMTDEVENSEPDTAPCQADPVTNLHSHR